MSGVGRLLMIGCLHMILRASRRCPFRHLANGHLDIVKLLSGMKEIDVNQRAAEYSGVTALYMVSQNGHSEIVKLLLGALLASSDIDINEPMTNGATPLIIASNLGQASLSVAQRF